jgi:hypothetical protein
MVAGGQSQGFVRRQRVLVVAQMIGCVICRRW